MRTSRPSQFPLSNATAGAMPLSLNARVVAAVAPHVWRWPIKIIGMSATLSNGAELAGWLGATLHVSDFRPIPLDERVLVSFAYSSMRSLTRNVYRADGVGMSHPFHQMGQPIALVSCPS